MNLYSGHPAPVSQCRSGASELVAINRLSIPVEDSSYGAHWQLVPCAAPPDPNAMTYVVAKLLPGVTRSLATAWIHPVT